MTTAGRSACACSSQNPQTDPPAPDDADGPGTDSKRPPDRRGREPTPPARPRRGLRARLGDALAGHARMAGHRGRLLRDRLAHAQSMAESMATDIPGAQLGRGRPSDLDAGSLRPRDVPVCPRPGIGARAGETDGGRGRALGHPIAGRPPPDRPGHRCRTPMRTADPSKSCAGQTRSCDVSDIRASTRMRPP